MDKTRNKIFVGCLALLLVMVAGYALFSQNLNITGTAKAQGEFSLSMTCTPGILDEIKNYDADYGSQSGYSNDSCSVANDTVTFHADLAYPTARRYFTVKVVNTGSVTAVDENFNLFYSDINGTTKSGSQDCLYKISDDSVVQCGITTNIYGESASRFIKKSLSGETTIVKFGDYNNKLVLEPGETFYIVYGMGWPSNWDRKMKLHPHDYYIKSVRKHLLDFVQETK